MSDIRQSIKQLEEPEKSIGEILIEFYETMKGLEKDSEKGGKQATKIVMTISDVSKLIAEKDLIIHGIEEGAENWEAEYDNCRDILKELVDLKIMKENLYKGNPDGKEYAERKPKAWEAAKAFLSTYQHEGW